MRRLKAMTSVIWRDLQRGSSLVGVISAAIFVLGATVAFLSSQRGQLDGTTWLFAGAFVASQVAWYLFTAYLRSAPVDAVTPHDRELLNKFLDLLPSNSLAVDFMCEGTFLARFDPKELEPFDQFAREWVAPEYEFIDEAVEDAKQVLLQAWSDLDTELSRNVFVDERPGNTRLGTKYALEHAEMQFMGIPEADKAFDVANELNALAEHVCAAHREFVRMAVARIRGTPS